jgi:ribosomal protein S18 acetylase RimI-like enzyme
MAGHRVIHFKRALQQHGIKGCWNLALTGARRSVADRLYLHERHVWFVLWTGTVTPVPLADGLVLVRGGWPQLDLLSEQRLCSQTVAARYLTHGGQAWIVMHGRRAAFCCWIFQNQMPLVAVRGGWQRLPVPTACLEASVTSPDYRGQGIAPAAWRAIAVMLGDAGIRSLVTKVEEENAASRRAVEKAGFREIAVMDFRRIGLWRSKFIQPCVSLLSTDLETVVDLQKAFV